MEIDEVSARWAASASKWVWSTQPRFVFEEDGEERQDLEPVDEVLPSDYDDDGGWWTCHKDAKIEDLAVIYRNLGRGDPELFPVVGPKDLCYVVLATSEPFELTAADDPGRFIGAYACRCVVVSRFEPTIGIEVLRRDPLLKEWGALRAGFVKAAMSMPDEVWDRLIDIAGSEGPLPPSPPPEGPRRKRRRRGRRVLTDPGERRRLEYRLEAWLEQHPESLERFGYRVAVEKRQKFLPGHDGTMDVWCRRLDRKDSYLVIELKAGEIQRDAIAQVLGYVGWSLDQLAVSEVSGIVIGLGQHVQVPWVLAAVEGIRLLDWSEFDLPSGLSDELGLIV